MQTISKPIQTLKQQIATSRQRLQDLYDTKGTTDAEVLAAGIELDQLLNQYDKLTLLTGFTELKVHKAIDRDD